MNTKIIKFDLNKYKLYENIKAKQKDTKSRFLLFQLLDGSIPFDLTNRSVRAYMIKPDGNEIFNDLIINNYSLGYCTLELTNQVLAVPGKVKIELMIIEEDKKLTSSVFEIEVIKSINSEKSIVSTNEFTALLNGLASLSEYDNYKNEIKNARGGEVKLKDRLDKFGEQLDKKANQNDLEGTIKRVDNLIIESGDSNVEVTDARTSTVKNKTFSLLKDRFEEIEKVINLTVENLVVNGGFTLDPGSKWWTILGTLISDTDNELVFISTGTNGRVQRAITFNEGDLIYRCAMVKTTSSNVGIGNTSTLLTAHSGSGQYELVSNVSDTTSKYISIVDKRTSGWDNISVKNVCAINLTDVFGKGYEPTKTEMDFMFLKRGWFDGSINDFINFNTYYNIFKDFKEDIYSDLEKAKYEPIYANNELCNIKSIAHRGYSIEAPENTLPAYTLAKKKGFKYVECDVQYTSDNIPVLLHNSTIDATSNGTGAVAEKTLDELKALDFGSYKGEQYVGTKIPTFEEFILHCKKLDLHPYIELKVGGTTQLTELMQIIKRLGMQRNVTWIGSIQKMAIVLKLDNKARVGWVTSNITDEGITNLIAMVTSDNYVFADLDYTTITSDTSIKLLDGGVHLECYTVNDEASLENLINMGVTGITTDSINITEYINKQL